MKNSGSKILLFVAFALILTACGENGVYSGKLIVDGLHRIARGQTEEAELLVSGGQLILEEGSWLNGSVYIIGGKGEVDGAIRGNLSLFAGELALGPHADIQGNLNIGGGKLDQSPQATIRGKLNRGTGIAFPQAPLRQRVSLAGTLFRAVSLAVLAFLAVRFSPGSLNRLAEAITAYPLVMGAMGALTGIVGLTLIVLMAYTILLIPVSILALFLMGLSVAFGWIALGWKLGRYLASKIKWDLQPPAAAFLGTLLLVLILDLTGLIPFAGGVLGILTAVLGLGAVMLTRFGLHKFVPSIDSLET